MARQKTRPANDRANKKYKLNNQRLKNKIKKLEKHCKKFPEDEVGKANLERILKEGITDKKPPRIPGLNKERYKEIVIKLAVPAAYQPKPAATAREQLAELLGVSLPENKPKRRRKPQIRHKRKKNVRKA